MNSKFSKFINKANFYLLVTFVLSLMGFVGALSVSYNTFTGLKPCPQLFIVPACYAVALGYGLILLSLLFKKNKVFYIGWTPVFVIALLASISELSGVDTCPKNAAGLPLCYASLLMLVAIFISYNFWKRSLS